MRNLLSLCLVAVALATCANAGAAEDVRLVDQLTQYNVIIADLAKRDTDAVAQGELAKIRSWFAEAQAQLAAENEDAVRVILRRFKPEVQYVNALINLAERRGQLTSLKKRNDHLIEETGKLKSRVAALDKRRRDLEAEVKRRDGGDGLKQPGFGGQR